MPLAMGSLIGICYTFPCHPPRWFQIQFETDVRAVAHPLEFLSVDFKAAKAIEVPTAAAAIPKIIEFRKTEESALVAKYKELPSA